MKYKIFIAFLLVLIISCQDKKDLKEVSKKDLKQVSKKITKIKEIKYYNYYGFPKLFSDTLAIYGSQTTFLDSKKCDSLVLKIDYKQKQDSLYKVIDEELDWCDADTMWVNPVSKFLIK